MWGLDDFLVGIGAGVVGIGGEESGTEGEGEGEGEEWVSVRMIVDI